MLYQLSLYFMKLCVHYTVEIYFCQLGRIEVNSDWFDSILITYDQLNRVQINFCQIKGTNDKKVLSRYYINHLARPRKVLLRSFTIVIGCFNQNESSTFLENCPPVYHGERAGCSSPKREKNKHIWAEILITQSLF